jgi:hypothetical protein
MCTIISENGFIAKKDISCYVVRQFSQRMFGDVIQSPYNDMRWNLNETKTTGSDYIPVLNDKIGGGYFHSFTNKVDAFWEKNDWAKNIYHSYEVFKAIIPAGSVVAKGIFQPSLSCYVSNALVLLERLA